VLSQTGLRSQQHACSCFHLHVLQRAQWALSIVACITVVAGTTSMLDKPQPPLQENG